MVHDSEDSPQESKVEGPSSAAHGGRWLMAKLVAEADSSMASHTLADQKQRAGARS